MRLSRAVACRTVCAGPPKSHGVWGGGVALRAAAIASAHMRTADTVITARLLLRPVRHVAQLHGPALA